MTSHSTNGASSRQAILKKMSADRPKLDAAGQTRILNVRPDPLDFRDKMYEPTLVEVPAQIDLRIYQKWGVPVLDQENEGACTGFGIATVANYLLRRRYKRRPTGPFVSPRMFYEMAKRYDEWPGEEYEGSSARGAMKGWHKHGVCAEDLWQFVAHQPGRFTAEAMLNALQRPLGAYYRVNHKDIVAMHSALAEVGILYATAILHPGWEAVDAKGFIPYERDTKKLGGHAFAIVAYDDEGFWIQNSWGVQWGAKGFARLTYDDWLAHGTDVWVARLGVAIKLDSEGAIARVHDRTSGQATMYSYCELRPHMINLHNDGRLKPIGTYASTPDDVAAIFSEEIPAKFKEWKLTDEEKRPLFLYAHGGLVSEESAVQRLAENRVQLAANRIYPLAFIWRTDMLTTLGNILSDAVQRRRPEGLLDSRLDFILDRLDDMLEPFAWVLGKSGWDEMKENAWLAWDDPHGGAYQTLQHLAKLAEQDKRIEVHIAAHSAGAIFHAGLVQLWTTDGIIESGPLAGRQGFGRHIASCSLWAPACTIDLFKQAYLPAIQAGKIEKFTLFTLTDEKEQADDCVNIYHKSVLYLVSNALEDTVRLGFPIDNGVGVDGEPLLGLEKFIRRDSDMQMLFGIDDPNNLKEVYDHGRATWIRSPNTAPEMTNGKPSHRATAVTHGGFDEDKPTLRATIGRVLGQQPKPVSQITQPSTTTMQQTRAGLPVKSPERAYP